jgi:glycolate oxidase FAD binding subunit
VDLAAGVIDAELEEMAAAVAGADVVNAVGARTQWETANPPAAGTAISAPAGILRYEPDDLTVTVGAGTSYADLDAALAAHGQECALDPRDPAATVGGIVACGLSGIRRLRHGPLRDHVLEVRFLTGDGRVVKGGGPTVKNVTGYDVPRLFVGSFGTLGVLAQLTLRCRPRPAHAHWFATDEPVDRFRAAAMLWDGHQVFVRLEGAAVDVDAQSAGLRSTEIPELPTGAHRGRISVPPGALKSVGAALAAIPGARWCAELGVGTVHVAGDDASVLVAARAVAHDHNGWMLREAGGDDLDGFGRALPNATLMRRVKDAFDPTGKLAPGRLPL